MKIDIHVHTKKVKSGDAPTRNIDASRFSEIIRSTDVKILAITNHNHFDLNQFEEFESSELDGCLLWPGIELDILQDGKRSHLLVIVNPKNKNDFKKAVDSILNGKNPESFTITLEETVQKFDALDCIYVAHYFVKKPSLSDEDIELLTSLTPNPKRILKEATNSISAGIYISHGHNTVYGSDVHNWDSYIKQSKDLPELRLPVQSFEQFCLLLEKDEATINTLLDRKVKENIELNAFGVAELIRLDIYDDINILFGSKGTGKTELLKALSKHYNLKGHKTKVYKSSNLELEEVFDLKGKSFDGILQDYGIDNCEEEIQFIKEVTEEEVTSLSKYLLHFSREETNRISQKLKIKDITKLDEKQSNRKLAELSGILKKFQTFSDYVNENPRLYDFIEQDLIDDLIDVLDRILSSLISKTENSLIDSKTIVLVNHIVEVFQSEISKKTGIPKKPSKTGFSEYASNRIAIEKAVNKIIDSLNEKIDPQIEYVGNLGEEKGDLYCQTNLAVQDGVISSTDYSPVRKHNKRPLKDFAKGIKSISKYIYTTELFEKIAELNENESIDSIFSLDDLLLFNRHFSLNGNNYEPSTGESSMILLHRELSENKDIYLIDEPEKSLGNDYINDVIVPLLKEKALLGKKVIIATHDANIAVRTLPYNSIYRLHETGRYLTFAGNPFSNKLKCINGEYEDLDWKEISMKTLEGGRNAFGERGKIYGN